MSFRVPFAECSPALQEVHKERMVHSDLKPANFLMVKGQLKLIDFGIAKTCGSNTTSIQRETQVGTVDYMSPESLGERGELSALSLQR
jgi:serine/threonine-protein kinase TTK/MPS1